MFSELKRRLALSWYLKSRVLNAKFANIITQPFYKCCASWFYPFYDYSWIFVYISGCIVQTSFIFTNFCAVFFMKKNSWTHFNLTIFWGQRFKKLPKHWWNLDFLWIWDSKNHVLFFKHSTKIDVSIFFFVPCVPCHNDLLINMNSWTKYSSVCNIMNPDQNVQNVRLRSDFEGLSKGCWPGF